MKSDATPQPYDGPVDVLSKTRIAPEVFAFELARPDGVPLPLPAPGAHVLLRFGDYERRYSLLPPVTPGSWRIAVLRDAAGRGGSVALCDGLEQGATLTAQGPENYFPLDTGHPHVMLIAGGIGITPIFAMAGALWAAGTPFTLHYAVRAAAAAPLLDEIRAAPWADALRLHVSEQGTRLNLVQTLLRAPSGSHLYVCGPERLNKAALEAALDLGWDSGRSHVEHFATAEEGDAAANGAFWVELKSTGERFEVPEGKTIVAVLEEEGIFLSTSCSEGVCGMCVTGLLSGRADHRDAVLSAAEHEANTSITPCCSRALPGETLVLDL
ncbi:PDR/VanB family oxidoreductase [Thalassovita mangrovi]|nr:PDR/VanB family oxidoreductase [Thalassovita mangrovi]